MAPSAIIRAEPGTEIKCYARPWIAVTALSKMLYCRMENSSDLL